MNDREPERVSPEMLAKLDRYLGQCGYQLNDDRFAHAVLTVMVRMKPETFFTVACLDKAGHHVDVHDPKRFHLIVEHGPVVAAAFGYLPKLGGGWGRFDHMQFFYSHGLGKGHWRPELNAAHDWCLMRSRMDWQTHHMVPGPPIVSRLP